MIWERLEINRIVLPRRAQQSDWFCIMTEKKNNKLYKYSLYWTDENEKKMEWSIKLFKRLARQCCYVNIMSPTHGNILASFGTTFLIIILRRSGILFEISIGNKSLSRTKQFQIWKYFFFRVVWIELLIDKSLTMN